MSMPPKCARAASKRAMQSSGFPTSPCTAMAVPPLRSISLTTSVAESSGARKSTSTVAPASPNASAIARPMPELAPVTSARCPSRSRRAVVIAILCTPSSAVVAPGRNSGRDYGSCRRQLAEPPFAQVLHRCRDLLARVHHERPVARDRLVDRLAGEHEKRRVLGGPEPHLAPRAIELHDLRGPRRMRAVDLQRAAKQRDRRRVPLRQAQL